MGELLKDKNILIMGVRNKWSIAWGIAQCAANEGANLIFTCQGKREKEDLIKISAELGTPSVFLCDITSDEELDTMFEAIGQQVGKLDGIVHAIANAKTEDLQNDYVYTSRDGFAHAMNVSAYSLVAVCKRAMPLMNEGSSVVTLTYMGSEKVFRGYNVMGVCKAALEASVMYLASDMGPKGIKVNAISAGPVKTMSAKGVKSLGTILGNVEKKAPLRRGITTEDIGKNALYLLSDLSGGVTGEIIHVDSGFNIMGI